ncbi:acyltransferase family protein, partial [Acinetobacter baumannii]
ACCMVILLHTAAEYVLKSNNTDWLIANVVDSFTRVCVPLFFMISGYLFFSNKTVKIKNFIKILTALTFYSFIAFIAT